jgi:hypothetical protein
MARQSWTQLVARHYYYGEKPRQVIRTMMNPGAPEPSRLADVRSFLEAMESQYVPEPIRAPLRDWPVWDVVGGPTNLTFSYLCAPGDEDRVWRLVRDVMVPTAERTAALLGEANGESPWSVDVVFAAVDAPRKLPQQPGEPVGPEHLNGGVTAIATGRVLVYREEDAEKVLVHELVHRFGLDDGLRPEVPAASRAAAALAREFGVRPISMHLGLNEAYTEALACFLHANCVAARTGSDPAEKLSVAGAHYLELSRLLVAHHQNKRQKNTAPFGNAERTHAFAYVHCRAALFQPKHLQRLLDDYPPGSPPRDAAEFTRALTEALTDLTGAVL